MLFKLIRRRVVPVPACLILLLSPCACVRDREAGSAENVAAGGVASDPSDSCAAKREALLRLGNEVTAVESPLKRTATEVFTGAVIGALVGAAAGDHDNRAGAAAGGAVVGAVLAADPERFNLSAALASRRTAEGLRAARPAFADLAECRLNQGRLLKGLLAEGGITRSEAERDMAGVRARFGGDVRAAENLKTAAENKLRRYVHAFEERGRTGTEAQAEREPVLRLLRAELCYLSPEPENAPPASPSSGPSSTDALPWQSARCAAEERAAAGDGKWKEHWAFQDYMAVSIPNTAFKRDVAENQRRVEAALNVPQAAAFLTDARR